MKITHSEVFVLGDPPGSETGDAPIMELAFVRIHTDEGISGISEIFAVPPGVAKAVLDGADSYFGAMLAGENPTPPERLWAKLYNALMHRNRRGWAVICLGAVDVALWDIYGKAMGRPVWQLMGGAERPDAQVSDQAQRREVVPYCTIVSEHWDGPSVIREQVEKVATLRKLGYRAVKVEPMRQSSETVVELARQARAALGADGILCVDVGYLWNDVGLAYQIAQRLAEFDVFFLETPFPVDSLEAYARLSARSPIRIAAGEHTVTRWEFLDLIDRGGIHVAQPWMTTCGGLTEARRIVELAQPRGTLVCPGNWSTQALGAASVHLAAISPVTPVIEFPPAEVHSSPLRKAIQELAPPVVNGVIAFPASPGLGIVLPDDLIARFRVG